MLKRLMLVAGLILPLAVPLLARADDAAAASKKKAKKAKKTKKAKKDATTEGADKSADKPAATP